LLLGGVRPNEEQKHGQDFERRGARALFSKTTFLEGKKVRAALGEGKPESIISTACVMCQADSTFFAPSAGSFSTRSHSSRATTCA
jgi:hypothetical protein